LVIRSDVNLLTRLSRYFFTDGQANDALTNHYNDPSYLSRIDWKSIQTGNFSKSDGDFDRPRRYQAEFLVHHHVPATGIESLHVYDQKAYTFVEDHFKKAGINISVHETTNYFF
jgi:hypothetical protein